MLQLLREIQGQHMLVKTLLLQVPPKHHTSLCTGAAPPELEQFWNVELLESHPRMNPQTQFSRIVHH